MLVNPEAQSSKRRRKRVPQWRLDKSQDAANRRRLLDNVEADVAAPNTRKLACVVDDLSARLDERLELTRTEPIPF